MAKKIYVGGLPYATTEEELRELFSPHGELESVNIIMDRFTGKSKGFAFIEMASDEAAEKAIEAVNGHELGGRTLTVNEARPPKPRGEQRRGGGGGGGFRGGGNRRGGGGGGGGHRGGGHRSGDQTRNRW